MAFTTPRTWVAGEVVTAALGNTHWRDNLRYLRGLDGVVTIDSGLVIDNTDGDEYLLLPLLSTAETATVLAAEGKVAFDEATHAPKYHNGTAVKQVNLLSDCDITSAAQGDILHRNATVWQRLAIGTAGQFLKTNAGATAPAWTSAVPSTVVYKSSNETVNNSAVLQNDDALVLAVSANERYLIFVRIGFSSSAVADIQIGFTIPAASTLTYCNFAADTWSAPALTPAEAAVPLAGGGVGNIAYTDALLEYIGGANAGNIQLQWAQNTQEATNTIVYAGSFMLADKIV